MATFDTPDDGLAAALDMRRTMERPGAQWDESDSTSPLASRAWLRGAQFTPLSPWSAMPP
jgi:hypothetical protein